VITGLHHASYCVASLDRSIAFYRDLLGFEVEWRVDADQSSAIRTQVGYPEAEVSVAQLRTPGHGPRLELIAYESAGEADRRRAPERRTIGASHVCLVVDDIRAEVARLTQAGVQFVSEPQFFDDDDGIWAVYFLDPDGITVELVELLEGTES
jgi:catechol 2,3-dioxygenase-like lactoylglutathione lyase family enzyme